MRNCRPILISNFSLLNLCRRVGVGVAKGKTLDSAWAAYAAQLCGLFYANGKLAIVHLYLALQSNEVGNGGDVTTVYTKTTPSSGKPYMR